MLNQVRPAVVCFAALTTLTGVLYPAIVTGVARAAFGGAATGGVIERDGHAVGSSLIAQPFTGDRYFWPRPSAASYAGDAGSGSYLGPTNPALAEAVAGRVQALPHKGSVPADLVTASGSGLDPHISPAAAEAQVERVARARGLTVAGVREIVFANTEGRTFGILGEPRVNVLRLNLALDHPTVECDRAAATTSSPAVGWRSRGFATVDR